MSELDHARLQQEWQPRLGSTCEFGYSGLYCVIVTDTATSAAELVAEHMRKLVGDRQVFNHRPHAMLRLMPEIARHGQPAHFQNCMQGCPDAATINSKTQRMAEAAVTYSAALGAQALFLR